MAISYSVRGTPLHSTTGPFTMNDGGTPTTGKLLIAFCNASGQTGTGNASFSGYGLTWTKIGEYGWNSNRESVIFAAFSAGATSAAPTYTPSETPGNGAHVIVLEVTLDSLPTSVYDCFRDQGGGTYVLGNSGTTGAAGNVTLATSPWATANRSFLFAEHGSPSGTNYVLSAETDMTAINSATGYTSPTSDCVVAWSNAAYHSTPGWTRADTNPPNQRAWGAVGFELIANAVTGIQFTNLGSSATPDFAGASGTSYLTSSWSPPTTGLIVCCVTNATSGSVETQIPTMSGNGLTWTNILTHSWSLTRRNTIFAAKAEGATTGQTTVSFGSETQNHCNAMFFQVTGLDTSGTADSCFVSNNKQYSSGYGLTSYVYLDPAQNTNNRAFGVVSKLNATDTIAPGSGWTELDEFESGKGSQTQCYPTGFPSVCDTSWTANSVPWGALAVEVIAAQQAAGVTVTDPFGVSGFFGV